MAHILDQGLAFAPSTPTGTVPEAGGRAAAGRALAAFPWRRTFKYGLGAALLVIGAVASHHNVVVRTSKEAVINGRIVSVRAPMDGIVTTTARAHAGAVEAGMTIGQIDDPHPDDARVFALRQEAGATERERDMLSRRLTDLQRARAEASAQAETYRVGRVQQDELRVEGAQASLAAATAREANAVAIAQRGAALHARGFQSAEVYERARHAHEVMRQETVAARKRLDSLQVELAAARTGTYLGDNYNDVPSSFQRARELALRIDETQAAIDQLTHKAAIFKDQLIAEERRLAARSAANLTIPVSGNLWTVQATSGEYVRKGQDLLSVVDCSTAMVTASVSEREYNQLRIGGPIQFRVSGTNREYAGTISKLGLASTGATFAISPEERRYQVAVNVPGLAENSDDRCAVGRVGEVVFGSHGDGIITGTLNTLRRSLGFS